MTFYNRNSFSMFPRFELMNIVSMKIFLPVILLIFLAACAGTGVVATNDQDIKRYEARRDTEKLVAIAKSNDKRESILAMEALGNLRDPNYRFPGFRLTLEWLWDRASCPALPW